jgi:DNA-directed RNA polymerase subunit alpha
MRIRWKEFELPTRVVLDEKTASATYGRFVAEPFERGFATTVGNALRRVLYSSIEGAAVTWVKVKGVPHEFTTLKGVLEDVTDIVLNLKQLVVRVTSETPVHTLKIEKSKKGPVRASDIQAVAGVEIVNPDLVLCTLVEDTDLSLEVGVRRGRRYIPAEEHSKEQIEIGVIPIDASFSPVRRVRYGIEATRVGKLTDYERLILEVWTTGTVSPEEAMVEATKILRKHLNPFVQYFEAGRELQINEKKEEEMRKHDKEVEEVRSKLSMSISELDLSVRSANCLAGERIETIGELVSRSEADLLKVRNFGKTSLREVKKKLQELGLSLGMDVEGITGKKPSTGGNGEGRS